MALAEVDKILEIMKTHQQKLLQQNQQEIEQQRADVEGQRAKDEQQQKQQIIDNALKQQSVENEFRRQQLTAEMAAHKLAAARATQELGLTQAQTGIAPAGSIVNPTASSQGPTGQADYTPTSSQSPNVTSQQQMIVPGAGVNGADLNIPTMSHQAYIKQQAADTETLAAPARATEEAKLKLMNQNATDLAKIKEEAETKRQLFVNAQTQAAELEREKLRTAGENWRTQLTTNMTKYVADKPYSFMDNIDPQSRAAIIQPSVDALATGDMSVKQVNDNFNEKGMAGAGMSVVGQFMKNGGVPANDKQVQFKQQLNPIVKSLDLIQQYIQMLPQTSNGVSAFVTGLTHNSMTAPKLDALAKEIEFNIAPVAKTLGGDEGQRLQKALLGPAEGGYLPDKSKTTTANVMNYNRLLKIINEAVDSKFANMPAAQRATIKSSLGLDKFKSLDASGVSAVDTKNDGVTYLTPEAVKLMQKHGIANDESKPQTTKTYTEQEIRTRAKTAGVDPELAISEAKKAHLLQ